MEALWQNLGQVAVIAAFIALAGVILKAVSDWSTSSRSKYVDVIAAERIKWVSELRGDLKEFIAGLDQISQLASDDVINVSAINERIEKTNSHLALIQLKLNSESKLDTTLLSLMKRCAFLAKMGDIQEYSRFRGALAMYISFLLKDEWEKAKREASGPVRWLWLYWNQARRLRMRAHLEQISSVRSMLETARNFSPAEESQLMGVRTESPPKTGTEATKSGPGS